MKLLAKTAEERYQTAAGVEHDLRRCLAAWETQRRIDDFPLGAHDTPDRLLIPEKLYGRAREVDDLARRLRPRGHERRAGAGAGLRVRRHRQVLGGQRVAQGAGAAARPVRRPASSTSSSATSRMRRSRRRFRASSGAFSRRARPTWYLGAMPCGRRWARTARLMVDLVPELRLLIGDQPPVPELPPQDAQRRFQLVFRRFLGVFARPEHPLALFLDDLQWLDAATLDLVEHLLTQPDVRHLMLIGAYRDNEVDAAHPLRRKLDGIRQAGALVQEIRLAPLARDDVGQLDGGGPALRASARRPAGATGP